MGFTATQYALFSSLYAIPGRLIASQSGRIVESADVNDLFADPQHPYTIGLLGSMPRIDAGGAAARGGAADGGPATGRRGGRATR